MTYEEALNKMQDYGLDDEGDEAAEKLSEALNVLSVLAKWAMLSEYEGGGHIEIQLDSERCKKDYETIRKWLEETK